ncbi:MAG TPA: hypothetical protein VMR54_12770, partial [Thermoanaerobaculia bacterium]|nr:hypothetical protein [Thermoanaerobaculia bacterium]
MWRSRVAVSLAAIAIALQATTLYGGVNQWTTHGPPEGIHTNGLAVDPADPHTIYAASESGIFKSVDGGASWQALAPGNVSFADVTCLAVDPTQPTTVYAGKRTGEFLRSHDGGTQWENREIDSGALPISIAVDAGTGAIYVGTQWDNFSNPVYRSTDGGTTWGGTAIGGGSGYALLADSLNQTVMVGTDYAESTGFYLYPYGGDVARTLDSGASWSFAPDDLGSPVLALAKDSQGSVYYAGTANGALYRSFNRGANWALLATLPGSVGSFLALAVDPSAPSVLYAATGRGVLRSSDAGASWRSFNAGMSTRDVRALVIDATGQILHVGTDQGV